MNFSLRSVRLYAPPRASFCQMMCKFMSVAVWVWPGGWAVSVLR